MSPMLLPTNPRPDDQGLPEGLFGSIIQRIGLEKIITRLRKRITLSQVLLVTFLILAVIIVLTIRAEINESGFFVFTSLLFSDSKIVLTQSSDFILSILESIPALEVALFFGLVGVMLFALRFLSYYLDELSQVGKRVNNLLKYNK